MREQTMYDFYHRAKRRQRMLKRASYLATFLIGAVFALLITWLGWDIIRQEEALRVDRCMRVAEYMPANMLADCGDVWGL